MASPAAVLSVLVKADGIAKTNAQLQSLHGDLDKSSKVAGRLGDDLDKSSRKGSKALGALKSSAGLAAGAIGAAGLVGALGAAVSEFREAQKATAQTNAVIKSTGGVANVTTKHVGDLANAISKKAGIDDEAIQSGENLLLTFKGVRNEVGKGNDIFDQATQTITDMSVSLKQGLKPSAIQVGKALNDPVKGITALSRVGVTFTEGQKKMIEGMVKSGDQLGAQKVILKELKSEFGGSAEAAATAGDKFKVSIGNLAEAAGSVLVPVLDKVASFLSKLINQMIEGKGVGGQIVSVFKAVGGAIGSVVGVIKDVVAAFQESKAWAVLLVAAVGALTAGFVAYKTIMVVATAASKALAAAQVLINVAMTANPVVLVVAAIAALVAGLIIAYNKSETFRNIVNALFGVLKTVAGAVWDFITSLKDLPGRLYDAGKGITEGVINGIKALPGLLANAATWLWERLKDGLKGYLDAYKAVGGWILARIIDGFKIVTDLLKSIGGWVFNRISDFIKLEIAGFKAVGGWLLNRIVDGFKLVTDLLKTVGTWVKNRIVDFIKLEIDGFTNVGSWIVNRVVDGFKVVTKALGTVGNWIKNRIVDFIQLEADGFKNVGGTIIGWIVDGFKGGVNLLVDLVNKVIDVVNVIPGIPNIKHVGHVGGGGSPGKGKGGPNGTGKLAKGGMVPGSGYGDKVPLHIAGKLAAMVEPGEMVSVANRNATAALMGVNSAIPRYADGGVLGGFRKAIGDIKPPPKANLALWEAGIVESGLRNLTYGDLDSRGALQIRDSTARGMGINNMDPYAAAVAFLTRGFWSKGGADILAIQNPKQSAGWVAQNTQGSAYPGRYDQVMSQALKYVKGYTGPVGGGSGVLGDVVSALNPMDFINKLPGVGDLPDWMKGTGKYILDKVTGWIKDKVSGLVGGDDGGHASGSVASAIKLAESLGFAHPGPGQLTGGDHVAGSLHYSGKAVDFGDAGHSFKQMNALYYGLYGKFGKNINELFYDREPWYIDAFSKHLGQMGGHKDHIHIGFAQGGVLGGSGLPFLGSYHTGGVAPREGLAHVSAGERMTPAGSGPLVHIEHAEFGSQIDVNSFAAKLGFKIATA
jgi:hypothetical protein